MPKQICYLKTKLFILNHNFNILFETITVYLFDLQNFIKSVNNDLSDNKLHIAIIEKAELLKNLSKSLSAENPKDKASFLKEIRKLSDEILSNLKCLKCDDIFLNEKTDLIVRTFSIWQHAGDLLSFENLYS